MFRRTASALLASLLSAACLPTADKTPRPKSTPPVSERVPRIDVHVESDRDTITFHFRPCDPALARANVRVLWVTETERNHPGDSEALVCSLKPMLDDGSHRIGEKWVFGQLPTGYRPHGCPPRLPVGVYGIHVSGAGQGGAFFEVDTAGRTTMLTEAWCSNRR